MKTVRGIATFGFGVIIPMHLANLEHRRGPNVDPDGDSNIDTHHDNEAVMTTSTTTRQYEADNHSLDPSNDATLTASSPTEHPVNSMFQYHNQMELDNELYQDEVAQRRSRQSSPGLNSPTRIPSTDDFMTLDKIQTGNINNYTTRGPSPPPPPPLQSTQQEQQHHGPLVFTEQLFAQVVQKAEIGRVMMDIENI